MTIKQNRQILSNVSYGQPLFNVHIIPNVFNIYNFNIFYELMSLSMLSTYYILLFTFILLFNNK